MSIVQMTRGLRRSIALDALISAGVGAYMMTGSAELALVWQLPHALVLGTSLFLFAWCASLLWLASRSEAPRAGVDMVIGTNGLWVLASAWIALGTTFHPTPQGVVFVVAQGLAVLVALISQVYWLRRAEARESRRVAQA